MTRYIIGARAKGHVLAGLRVIEAPPLFYGMPERITWRDTGYSFHAHRGAVQEWRDEGRLVVCRVFPEEFAAPLSEHDEAVAQAEASLKAARKSRQEFLEMVSNRAKPVRVEDARRERQEWPATEAGLAEAKAHEDKRQAYARLPLAVP
jgi:hypothetical protein